jgi:hypothetical protein
MKNILLFACFFLLSCPIFAQPFYVRLADASGFNTDIYQDSLEAAAERLVAAFPDSTYRDSFKVFDGGFYLHQEVTEGGYPEAFQQMILTAGEMSPYYLLFGKQTDKTGIYTKFWVEVKLPETRNFSCLTVSQREVISINAENYLNDKYSDNSSAYAEFEILSMDSIRNKIISIIDCCYANKGTNTCPACIADNDILELLFKEDFVEYDSVEISSFVAKTEDTNNSKKSTSAIFYDFVNKFFKIKGNSYNLVNEYSNRISEWNMASSQVVFIFTTNRHYCNDTINIANNIWQESPSVIWLHFFISEANKGVLFVKYKGLLPTPESYSCDYSGDLPYVGMKVQDIKNILNANSTLIQGDLNNNVGKFLEIAYFLSTAPVEIKIPNNRKFSSDYRKLRYGIPNVMPDFISKDLVVEITPKAKADLKVLIFYESKATTKTLSKSYRKGQLSGMIDALHTLIRLKIAKYGHFYIARTCDAKISDDLVVMARQHCIMLYEQVALLSPSGGISFTGANRLTSTCAEMDIDKFYRKIDFWNDPRRVTAMDVISNWNMPLIDFYEALDPDPRKDDDSSENP